MINGKIQLGFCQENQGDNDIIIIADQNWNHNSLVISVQILLRFHDLHYVSESHAILTDNTFVSKTVTRGVFYLGLSTQTPEAGLWTVVMEQV